MSQTVIPLERGYPAFCGMCGRNHEQVLRPDEFRMLAGLSPRAINPEGRLIIACDACQPFQYSGKGELH